MGHRGRRATQQQPRCHGSADDVWRRRPRSMPKKQVGWCWRAGSAMPSVQGQEGHALGQAWVDAVGMETVHVLSADAPSSSGRAPRWAGRGSQPGCRLMAGRSFSGRQQGRPGSVLAEVLERLRSLQSLCACVIEERSDRNDSGSPLQAGNAHHGGARSRVGHLRASWRRDRFARRSAL